ncbi:MAG: hypothetical protein HFJ42_03825 [Clostridia bacterium]|nr:hypothetical protein [Clostridia bacterium]
MEERSLRIYADKTFFTKLTNTLTKMLIPTKIGINSVIISVKRNNVLKNYETYSKVSNQSDETKKETLEKKYEETYSLYLEAIDKHVMDSIYKKVKNGTASEFEKDALSKYYNIIKIKDTEYLEYKYRKQKYLLELDYELVQSLNKEKLLNKYKEFYISKIDSLYKGLLKHFSIKLADNLSSQNRNIVYEKIFNVLEEYITTILPIKLEISENNTYKEVIEEYDKFENYAVGKLDQNELIEKRMVLIALSRKLFTHSLPLIVAEQCYIKLLKDVRSLIVDTKIAKKREKAYTLLIKLIEEYNTKLLSTKVYWDKPEKKERYKVFWSKYTELVNQKENQEDYTRKKEILFIRSDLKELYCNENKYFKIIQFYKNKLVSLGAMKNIKDKCKSQGTYIGRKVLCRS